MWLRRFSYVAVSAFLLLACGRSKATLPGLDTAIWSQDSYACRNQRTKQARTILEAKEELYGSTTASIEALLGAPDEEELAEQTEKTYYYYLEPGTQCEVGHPRSGANKLSVHFGAIGTVTEILTERPLTD